MVLQVLNGKMIATERSSELSQMDCMYRASKTNHFPATILMSTQGVSPWKRYRKSGPSGVHALCTSSIELASSRHCWHLVLHKVRDVTVMAWDVYWDVLPSGEVMKGLRMGWGIEGDAKGKWR
jgi:hypothetical protein